MVPNETVYRVMKGMLTKIDPKRRQLSFTWHNPHSHKDMPLKIAIKDGALIQVDYEDVPLDKIRSGRETTLMVRIESEFDGNGQKLTATAIRQNLGAAFSR